MLAISVDTVLLRSWGVKCSSSKWSALTLNAWSIDVSEICFPALGEGKSQMESPEIALSSVKVLMPVVL